MEAVLEGQTTMVRIRTSKVPGANVNCWPDSFADNYNHRPIKSEFKDICFYQMTSQYKKEYKKHKTDSIDTYKFRDNYPGYAFSRLRMSKIPTIPKISLPRHKLCPMEELELHNIESTEQSHYKREMYANNFSLDVLPLSNTEGSTN